MPVLRVLLFLTACPSMFPNKLDILSSNHTALGASVLERSTRARQLGRAFPCLSLCMSHPRHCHYWQLVLHSFLVALVDGKSVQLTRKFVLRSMLGAPWRCMEGPSKSECWVGSK